MDTLTGRLGFTDIEIGTAFTGFPDVQGKFEVSLHPTISLFEGIYENILLLLPILIPFTVH